MILKKGKYEIEIDTLPNQKRPSLLILRDRNLHSKVGIFMDDERAKEFFDYIVEMFDAKSITAEEYIGERTNS